jgi:hypothetical protein
MVRTLINNKEFLSEPVDMEAELRDKNDES